MCSLDGEPSLIFSRREGWRRAVGGGSVGSAVVEGNVVCF